jgi:uncharacterized tellurite resistance protein B-like protein
MVIHNNFKDFVLFLYVHMAHADGEFHESEIVLVRDKMVKLFHPEEVDIDAKLKEALKQYDAFDKSQLKSLFRDSFDHFNTIKFAQKYKVYSDMYDIIHADGKIDESETKALQELKEIIDINSEVSHQK